MFESHECIPLNSIPEYFFSQGGKESYQPVPGLSTLKPHKIFVLYGGLFWKSCTKPNPNLPSPIQYSWHSNLPALKALLELKICNYKTSSGPRN